MDRSRPAGITAISIIFVFLALLSAIATITLLFPGGNSELVWRLNPSARENLLAMGEQGRIWAALICGGCLVAAVGLWRCRPCGYWTGFIILTGAFVMDLINALVRHHWFVLVSSLPVECAMIWYLLKEADLFSGAAKRLDH